MEMDFKLASLILNAVQFVGFVVAFCIIKFNDLSHVERRLDKVETLLQQYQHEQNVRHEENLKAINSLSTQVAYLTGQQDALHE